jgi:hypothetical protein
MKKYLNLILDFLCSKKMVGLTNESPTFCFDRDELSTVELFLK